MLQLESEHVSATWAGLKSSWAVVPEVSGTWAERPQMAAHISLKSRSALHFCNMFTRFTFDQRNLEMWLQIQLLHCRRGQRSRAGLTSTWAEWWSVSGAGVHWAGTEQTARVTEIDWRLCAAHALSTDTNTKEQMNFTYRKKTKPCSITLGHVCKNSKNEINSIL